MKVSFAKVKDIIKKHTEAKNSRYADLDMVLEELKEKESVMDGEEAILRFLYELSKAD